jgi:tetratricopeptide (TPR) repeat protein
VGVVTLSDSEADAQAHYASGVQLYGQERYEPALIEFEQAYRLQGDPRLLFNIGQIQYQLGRYSEALVTLRELLQRGGDKVPLERRLEVQRELEELRRLTGSLRLTVDVPGAGIEVDGKSVGTSPLLRPVLVNAGDHRVVATRENFARAFVQLYVSGGDTTDAVLHLPELRRSSGDTWQQATWIMAGGFAALALVSGIATVISYRHYDNARRSPQNADPARARHQLDSEHSRLGTLALVTDVLTGATLVSSGVALYLSLRPREQVALGQAGEGGGADRGDAPYETSAQLTAILEF